jgi:hypothetical protein
VIGDALAAQDEAHEPRAVHRRQAREREQLHRRRHLGGLAVVVEAAAEPAPAHFHAQLVREVEHAPVGRGDRVVEAVDAHAAELGAARETTELCRRLVDGHLVAGRGELVGQAEPEDAASDDADPAHGRALANVWRAMSRA